MSSNNNNISYIFSFSDIWVRIKEKTPIQTQSDLARIAGVSQAAVAKRKSINTWPVAWAYIISKEYNLSLDWILTGENAREDKSSNNYIFDITKDIENWLAETVRQDPDREAWFKIQFKESFPGFSEWIKRKEEEEGKSGGDPISKVA